MKSLFKAKIKTHTHKISLYQLLATERKLNEFVKNEYSSMFWMAFILLKEKNIESKLIEQLYEYDKI